ncbi:unnamed protein product [Amoebophrya sp. A120]|nr:unnamed protein product [Amoebophrya sp. A120]|eukprot:GSA120T00015530001.1
MFPTTFTNPGIHDGSSPENHAGQLPGAGPGAHDDEQPPTAAVPPPASQELVAGRLASPPADSGAQQALPRGASLSLSQEEEGGNHAPGSTSQDHHKNLVIKDGDPEVEDDASLLPHSHEEDSKDHLFVTKQVAQDIVQLHRNTNLNRELMLKRDSLLTPEERVQVEAALKEQASHQNLVPANHSGTVLSSSSSGGPFPLEQSLPAGSPDNLPPTSALRMLETPKQITTPKQALPRSSNHLLSSLQNSNQSKRSDALPTPQGGPGSILRSCLKSARKQENAPFLNNKTPPPGSSCRGGQLLEQSIKNRVHFSSTKKRFGLHSHRSANKRGGLLSGSARGGLVRVAGGQHPAQSDNTKNCGGGTTLFGGPSCSNYGTSAGASRGLQPHDGIIRGQHHPFLENLGGAFGRENDAHSNLPASSPMEEVFGVRLMFDNLNNAGGSSSSPQEQLDAFLPRISEKKNEDQEERQGEDVGRESASQVEVDGKQARSAVSVRVFDENDGFCGVHDEKGAARPATKMNKGSLEVIAPGAPASSASSSPPPRSFEPVTFVMPGEQVMFEKSRSAESRSSGSKDQQEGVGKHQDEKDLAHPGAAAATTSTSSRNVGEHKSKKKKPNTPRKPKSKVTIDEEVSFMDKVHFPGLDGSSEEEQRDDADLMSTHQNGGNGNAGARSNLPKRPNKRSKRDLMNQSFLFDEDDDCDGGPADEPPASPPRIRAGCNGRRSSKRSSFSAGGDQEKEEHNYPSRGQGDHDLLHPPETTATGAVLFNLRSSPLRGSPQSKIFAPSPDRGGNRGRSSSKHNKSSLGPPGTPLRSSLLSQVSSVQCEVREYEISRHEEEISQLWRLRSASGNQLSEDVDPPCPIPYTVHGEVVDEVYERNLEVETLEEIAAGGGGTTSAQTTSLGAHQASAGDPNGRTGSCTAGGSSSSSFWAGARFDHQAAGGTGTTSGQVQRSTSRSGGFLHPFLSSTGGDHEPTCSSNAMINKLRNSDDSFLLDEENDPLNTTGLDLFVRLNTTDDERESEEFLMLQQQQELPPSGGDQDKTHDVELQFFSQPDPDAPPEEAVVVEDVVAAARADVPLAEVGVANSLDVDEAANKHQITSTSNDLQTVTAGGAASSSSPPLFHNASADGAAKAIGTGAGAGASSSSTTTLLTPVLQNNNRNHKQMNNNGQHSHALSSVNSNVFFTGGSCSSDGSLQKTGKTNKSQYFSQNSQRSNYENNNKDPPFSQFSQRSAFSAFSQNSQRSNVLSPSSGGSNRQRRKSGVWERPNFQLLKNDRFCDEEENLAEKKNATAPCGSDKEKDAAVVGRMNVGGKNHAATRNETSTRRLKRPSFIPEMTGAELDTSSSGRVDKNFPTLQSPIAARAGIDEMEQHSTLFLGNETTEATIKSHQADAHQTAKREEAEGSTRFAGGPHQLHEVIRSPVAASKGDEHVQRADTENIDDDEMFFSPQSGGNNVEEERINSERKHDKNDHGEALQLAEGKMMMNGKAKRSRARLSSGSMFFDKDNNLAGGFLEAPPAQPAFSRRSVVVDDDPPIMRTSEVDQEIDIHRGRSEQGPQAQPQPDEPPAQPTTAAPPPAASSSSSSSSSTSRAVTMLRFSTELITGATGQLLQGLKKASSKKTSSLNSRATGGGAPGGGAADLPIVMNATSNEQDQAALSNRKDQKKSRSSNFSLELSPIRGHSSELEAVNASLNNSFQLNNSLSREDSMGGGAVAVPVAAAGSVGAVKSIREAAAAEFFEKKRRQDSNIKYREEVEVDQEEGPLLPAAKKQKQDSSNFAAHDIPAREGSSKYENEIKKKTAKRKLTFDDVLEDRDELSAGVLDDDQDFQSVFDSNSNGSRHIFHGNQLSTSFPPCAADKSAEQPQGEIVPHHRERTAPAPGASSASPAAMPEGQIPPNKQRTSVVDKEQQEQTFSTTHHYQKKPRTSSGDSWVHAVVQPLAQIVVPGEQKDHHGKMTTSYTKNELAARSSGVAPVVVQDKEEKRQDQQRDEDSLAQALVVPGGQQRDDHHVGTASSSTPAAISVTNQNAVQDIQDEGKQSHNVDSTGFLAPTDGIVRCLCGVRHSSKRACYPRK